VSKGYLYWVAPFFRGLPYLGGYELSRKFSDGLTWDENEGVFLLPTHGKTTIVQRPYLGTGRPLELNAIEFKVPRLAIDEEDWFRIRRVKAKAAAAYFVPYVWTEEVFEVTTSGTYTLGRMPAWGIAPGVTIVTHPPRYFVGDVENPAAATVTGQVLTSAVTGTLAVRYMPAFKVCVGRLSHALKQVNDMQTQIALTEVLEIPA
jgi:hypothetical protein